MLDKDLFPAHQVQMASGKNIEIGKMGESTFRTFRLRPFHSIWLGIPGNDCLAGNAERSTPQRWLVGTMDGAMTSVIERDNQYQGFIRCTPVKNPQGGIFGSLEIWVPLMIRRILVHDLNLKKGGLKVQPIFDVWFPHYLAGLPKIFKELVISESKLIDNFGIKQVIYQSPYFSTSHRVGLSSDFLPADEFVESVAEHYASEDISNRYGEGLIFDAKIRDSGSLVVMLKFSELAA